MRVDLVKLSITEDGGLLTGVHRQLRDDLGNERLRKLLSRMEKVAEIVAEVIREECENE